MPEETRKSLTLRVGETEYEYQLVRSRRRKRTIAFAVDPGPVLTVRAPARTVIREIEETIVQHLDWILRRMAEMRVHAASQPPREYVTGEEIPYLGNPVRLEVIPALGFEAKCDKRDGQFELRLPIALREVDARESGEAAVTAWFRERAADKFAERVEIWKRKLKVEPGRVIVTDPQTRWGSCDASNNIRLSWRILMAPLEIVDYIVAHELCHVVHRNHGPRFWRKLEKAMPDCLARRDRLREIGYDLTL